MRVAARVFQQPRLQAQAVAGGKGGGERRRARVRLGRHERREAAQVALERGRERGHGQLQQRGLEEVRGQDGAVQKIRGRRGGEATHGGGVARSAVECECDARCERMREGAKNANAMRECENANAGEMEKKWQNESFLAIPVGPDVRPTVGGRGLLGRLGTQWGQGPQGQLLTGGLSERREQALARGPCPPAAISACRGLKRQAACLAASAHNSLRRAKLLCSKKYGVSLKRGAKKVVEAARLGFQRILRPIFRRTRGFF